MDVWLLMIGVGGAYHGEVYIFLLPLLLLALGKKTPVFLNTPKKAKANIKTIDIAFYRMISGTHKSPNL